MSSGASGRPDAGTRVLGAAALCVGALLYLGGLDHALLQRGNEAMYACPPMQMLATGDYLVPRWENRNFLDKPPLTFWIVAASYRVLGVSVAAAKLPSALAGLGTAALLGAWVTRRAGRRSGLLASLILMLSFQFAIVSRTFAADTFLTLAVAVAVLTLDTACRREGGSDAARGIAAGMALALAFYFKGLVGLALPVGAVAAGLLLDRAMPARLRSRGAWALAALLVLLVPWHWAMASRLGAEFWTVFYWENQFLRGATPRFMQIPRGPFYYLGVLAWGIFPWSLLLPGLLRRRKPSSVLLGWFAFGFAFWSLLVMKREVYLVTVLPAAAALAAEGLGQPADGPRGLRRAAWIVAAIVPCAALVVWARALGRLDELAQSRGAALLLGAGLASLAAALVAAALRPDEPRVPFGVALACGLCLLSLRLYEVRLARLDPLPAWGEEVRAQCARGCDGFLYANNFNSIDFYSRFDWVMVGDPVRELPERLGHPQGFLVTWTSLEPRLAGLPLSWEVVDRRPAFRGGLVAAALGVGSEGLDSLSLVRIRRP